MDTSSGAEFPLPSLNHDVAACVTTMQSAVNVVSAISEPKELTVVSEAVDCAITVQSAYATAEGVAAYYAPLGQALEFVDHLLGAVSTLADVSRFYIQLRMY